MSFKFVSYNLFQNNCYVKLSKEKKFDKYIKKSTQKSKFLNFNKAFNFSYYVNFNNVNFALSPPLDSLYRFNRHQRVKSTKYFQTHPSSLFNTPYCPQFTFELDNFNIRHSYFTLIFRLDYFQFYKMHKCMRSVIKIH